MQMAFANKSFGFNGEAFDAEVGAHKVTGIGQKIVHVNVDNKTMSDFLFFKNLVARNHRIFRPIDIVFSQDVNLLCI